MSIANAEQRELMLKTGLAIVDAMKPQLAEWCGAKPSDEDWSQCVGKVLITAALFAGEGIERLNRVEMLFGMGHAFGELGASWPDYADGLFAALNNGVKEGDEDARKGLMPQGRA